MFCSNSSQFVCVFVCFVVGWFVSHLVGWLVCQRDNSKTTGQILTKFGWRMSPITHNWFKCAIYTKPLFLSFIHNLSHELLGFQIHQKWMLW